MIPPPNHPNETFQGSGGPGGKCRWVVRGGGKRGEAGGGAGGGVLVVMERPTVETSVRTSAARRAPRANSLLLQCICTSRTPLRRNPHIAAAATGWPPLQPPVQLCSRGRHRLAAFAARGFIPGSRRRGLLSHHSGHQRLREGQPAPQGSIASWEPSLCNPRRGGPTRSRRHWLPVRKTT